MLAISTSNNFYKIKRKINKNMKFTFNNIIFLVITLMFFLGVSCSSEDGTPDPINNIYLSVPDSIFESKLIELGIDSDGVINHKILKSDAEQVTHLDLNFTSGSSEISDLTGIEGFINITFLSATGQEIQDIDLSFNTKLDTLFLSGNLLTSIDISKNTNLVLLDIQANHLNTITGLSHVENLKKVNLSFNDFEDVSIDNVSVEEIIMTHNLLKFIDLEYASSLKSILLTNNQLETIDLSTNALLKTLLISDNQLSNINLEQNSHLEYLYISSNSLSSLDLSNNLVLIGLKADRNPDLTCIKIQSDQEIPTLSLSEYQELNEQCN